MLELRWLIKGTSKVLQYRIIETVTVSDHTYSEVKVFLRTEKVPGKWKNVPEFTEESVNVSGYE
jgi:hypothetical protein